MVLDIILAIGCTVGVSSVAIVIVKMIRAMRAAKTYSPLYSDIIAALLKDRITINADAEETDDPYAKLDDTDTNE